MKEFGQSKLNVIHGAVMTAKKDSIVEILLRDKEIVSFLILSVKKERRDSKPMFLIRGSLM